MSELTSWSTEQSVAHHFATKYGILESFSSWLLPGRT